MRAAPVLVAFAAALAVLAAPSARAADECRGLPVCIPVAGPWVAVPQGDADARFPQRSWRMKCPEGSIVGGVDARLTHRAVDMSFGGLLGSPVNPGITTTEEVVFTGTYTGGASRPTGYRPFIGCIPTAGGAASRRRQAGIADQASRSHGFVHRHGATRAPAAVSASSRRCTQSPYALRASRRSPSCPASDRSLSAGRTSVASATMTGAASGAAGQAPDPGRLHKGARRPMSFQWPLLLPLLAIVPLSVAAYVALERRRAKYAIRFTNLEVLAGVVDERRAWRRWLPPVLFFMALAAALLALSRPEVTVAAHREKASVILTIDSSGSMFAKDVPPTRLAAAQEAVQRFLDKLPARYRVGVVTFSSEAQVVAPLTLDRQVVRDAVEYLYPGRGTAIGDALARSVELAEQASGRALGETDVAPAEAPADDDAERPATAILLLSDGAQTAGILQPFEGAQRATTAKIPVYTVALGTPDGQVTFDRYGVSRTILVPPDPVTLEQIADDTDGEFYAAASGARLNEVYERLGSQIGRIDTKREVTNVLAAAGAVLLLGAGLLAGLWFPRFP